MLKNLTTYLAYPLVFLALILAGCSTTRHVPEGKMLLDNAKIKIENPQDSREIKKISTLELKPYLRQTPNTTVLGFLKLQLATYNLSGSDSTKRANKWFRKMGQAPVIFDTQKTSQSALQLRQAMINRGYSDAFVVVDTVPDRKKKKMKVTYHIYPGDPHFIRTINYEIPDSSISELVLSNLNEFTLKPGILLDRNNLEENRINITKTLRDNGYYSFSKEYITYSADTVAGKKEVDLTLTVHPFGSLNSDSGEKVEKAVHQQFFINKIYAVTNYDPLTTPPSGPYECVDTVNYKGITVLYGEDRYLRPSIIEEKCAIEPGGKYVASEIDRTYENLAQLGILKYINIILKEDTLFSSANPDADPRLNVYILLQKAKKQGVTLEVEGTNSEGDLGFGLGVTYRHRNLWKGSELLTAKIRTSYESISGNFDGFINDRYSEYAAEVGLTFPKFEAPFLSKSFKQKSRALSEVALSFNYQERPEYTRVIAGAAWRYKWNSHNNLTRKTFDLVDVNFVYLPYTVNGFLDNIAPTNPLLRYSYEDHFIMRMAFNFSKTNKHIPRAGTKAGMFTQRQSNVYSVRLAAETAGNLLYAISSIGGQKREDGAYKIFGIQYAQYVKGEADYTYTVALDSRNSFSFHSGFGIAVTYGDSAMVPFEKRFYAGGANGVRGWNVRTLGPGSYDAKNSVADFINQCGDIRLDLSVEYRARLFWVLEGALFIDGGNIWTIRNYENQPGGAFKFNRFYKEIAAAYGAGLRFDFTYFLVRFDLGMKAHNPAMNQVRWPLVNPNWKRDATFHFAVGYPF